MATAKRTTTKSKSAAKANAGRKKSASTVVARPAGRRKAPVKAAPVRAQKAAPRAAVAEPTPAPAPAPAISPITGLPVREKVRLPIKGYGRYNSFQVVELLYGKTVPELKQILAYEEKHQRRRMITDRINDMIRRASYK